MERPAELQTKRILNFAVTKIETDQVQVTVHGYFVIVELRVQGLNFGADIHYLTPPEEPMKWRLPRWIFPDTALEEVSATTAERAIVTLMEKCAIEVVPPAPMEVPWHNIPPSKHKAMKAKLLREKKGLPEKTP